MLKVENFTDVCMTGGMHYTITGNGEQDFSLDS